uniref:PHD-type domain-containing protein n=1 Tax=Pyramimonas obovata TaxID=1411642 RepID=A0A7S0WXZ3_9CHLO
MRVNLRGGIREAQPKPVLNAIEKCKVVSVQCLQQFVEDSQEPQYLLRVQLTRTSRSRLSDWVCDGENIFHLFVDLYASAATVGSPEFVIDWDRYKAPDNNWARGDKFQMFWRDTSSPELGAWWPGKVVDIRPRMPGEDGYMFPESPWGAVLVKWDDEPDGEPDRVNVWELAELSSQRTTGRRQERAPAQRATAVNDTYGGEAYYDGSSYDDIYEHMYSDPDSNDEEFRPRHQRSRAAGRGRKGATKREHRPPTLHGSKFRKVDRNSYFCYICGDGGELLECDGACLRSFHADCLPADHLPPSEQPDSQPEWFCKDCSLGFAACAACHVKGKAGVEVFKCRMGTCGHFFHTSCLRLLPRVKWHPAPDGDSSDALQSFTCPTHYCTGCHMSGDALRMINCWHCIDAYHTCCLPRSVMKLNEKNCKCDACIRFDASLESTSAGPQAVASSSSRPVNTASKRQRLPQPSLAPANPNSNTTLKHEVIHILDSDSEMEQTDEEARRMESSRADRRGATSSSGFSAATSSRTGEASSGGTVCMPPSGCEPKVPRRRLGLELPSYCTDPNPPRIVEVKSNGESVTKELKGKTVFYFGPHKRGGGCDWEVSCAGIKLHSRLDVERPGDGSRAVTRLMFLHPHRAADTPLLLNGATLVGRSQIVLKHGDIISINSQKFLFEHKVAGQDSAAPSSSGTKRIRITLADPSG